MSITVTEIRYTVEIDDGSGTTVTVSPITQTVAVASPGPQGATGPTVVSVAVGTTATGAAGSSASVANVGTSTAAVLDFTIPRGDKGETGAQGAKGDTGSTGAKGDKGDTGETGAQGSAATISVGSVSTGTAGSSASITNSGTSGAAVFDFSIPRGDKGETGNTGSQGIKGDTGATGATGAQGSAATISIGTVTQGTAVSVINVGTSSSAVFDFVLAKGDKGDTGATGAQGVKGDTGNTGPQGTAGVGVPVGGTAGQVLSKINSTDYNTQWVDQSGGASGTATTAGVYGVTTLTDSANSTSTTTAATPNSIKLFVDNLYSSYNFPTNGIETFSKSLGAVGLAGFGSGITFLTVFVPLKDMTVGTATFFNQGTATSPTLFRMGLYTWDEAAGTATLVARTANDTTAVGTSATIQSRAFDTAGGYPSTYTLVAGSAYAFGLLQVATTPSQYARLSNSPAVLVNSPRKVSLSKGSQTDLATAGTWTNSTNIIWGRFT